MDFYEVLDQVLDLLRQRGRVAYRVLKLQFKLEAFNFTNTPHLALPDNFVGDGSDFMTITGTQSLAREGIDERQFRIGFRLVF